MLLFLGLLDAFVQPTFAAVWNVVARSILSL